MKEITEKVILEDDRFASALRPALETEVPSGAAAAIRLAAEREAEKRARRRRYFRPRAFQFIATAAAAVTICAYSVTQYREMRKESIMAAKIEKANSIIDLVSLSMPEDTAVESEFYYYDLLSTYEDESADYQTAPEGDSLESMADRLDRMLAR